MRISAAGLRALLEGAQHLAVVAVEHARVGHEQLEAGDALADERLHLLERALVDVGHDHVERVVDRAVAVGLRVPGVEPLAQRAADLLDREVDDRGRAAPCGRAGAGLERVRRRRPAEGHLHVGVPVDPAGHDVAPGRIDLGVGRPRLRHGRPGGRQRDDRLVLDQHVRGRLLRGGDHQTAADHRPTHGATTSSSGDAAGGSPAAASSIDATSSASPSAASCGVNVSGGAMRSAFAYRPPLPISSPRRFAASSTALASSGAGSPGVPVPGRTSSTPIIRPLPRTSPTIGESSSRSPSSRIGPTFAALPCRSCASRYRRLANAPAAVIGEPPNVEIELPRRQSMISARAMTPPTDRPFPMPLANVTMSGDAPPSACACRPRSARRCGPSPSAPRR